MQSIGLVLDRIREIESRMNALSDMVKTRTGETTTWDGKDGTFAREVAKAREGLAAKDGGVSEEGNPSTRPAPVLPAAAAYGPSPLLATPPANPALASKPFAGLVDTVSRETRVPAELLHAVMQRESNYNPKAVSPKGAMGLMQLMPGTAGEVGVADPFDPEANVRGGAKYLRGLLDRYDGNVVKALAAYNAGPESLKNGRVPNYPETKEYVKKVIEGYVRMSGVDPASPSE